MSTPPEPVVPATPQTPAAPATPATPAVQPPTTPPTGQDPAAEVARLTKELEAARAEAAKTRVTAKENAAKEAREALLKQLSGDAPEPLTPEQLQQQLADARTAGTTAQQQAAATTRELAVLRTAQRLGANGDALLDSRSFMEGVAGLDTADPAALTAAVTERVNAALAANPALRAGPTAGRSGGDLGGGSGSGDGATTIDAQIAEATAAKNWQRVFALKRHKAAQQTT
jgi:hypothetical protein